MTVLTETFSAAPSFFGRLAVLRAKLVDAAAKRKVYRTTYAELDNLTSRELADLGIARTMIREIAYEAAYGK